VSRNTHQKSGKVAFFTIFNKCLKLTEIFQAGIFLELLLCKFTICTKLQEFLKSQGTWAALEITTKEDKVTFGLNWFVPPTKNYAHFWFKPCQVKSRQVQKYQTWKISTVLEIIRDEISKMFLKYDSIVIGRILDTQKQWEWL